MEPNPPLSPVFLGFGLPVPLHNVGDGVFADVQLPGNLPVSGP